MATRSEECAKRDFHVLYVDAELEFAAGAVTGPWGHSPGLALARAVRDSRSPEPVQVQSPAPARVTSETLGVAGWRRAAAGRIAEAPKVPRT